MSCLVGRTRASPGLQDISIHGDLYERAHTKRLIEMQRRKEEDHPLDV